MATEKLTRELVARLRAFADEGTIGLIDAALLATIDSQAREIAALNAKLEQAKNHAKGIVMGGTALEIADRILAEHEPELAAGKTREKLDDELCRICALASTIKQEVEKVAALKEALEAFLAAWDVDSGWRTHPLFAPLYEVLGR